MAPATESTIPPRLKVRCRGCREATPRRSKACITLLLESRLVPAITSRLRVVPIRSFFSILPSVAALPGKRAKLGKA
jgi:hypothetical protein